MLVDDGLASGFTMLAAARSVRKKEPEMIVVAVPTASAGAIQLLSAEVNEIVCLNIRTGPISACERCLSSGRLRLLSNLCRILLFPSDNCVYPANLEAY